MKEVTITEHLKGFVSILDVKAANPDIKRIIIEGPEAIRSVAEIMERVRFWPGLVDTEEAMTTTMVTTILLSRQIILDRDRKAPANIGEAFGFRWSYVLNDGPQAPPTAVMPIPYRHLPHFGTPLVCEANQTGNIIETDGWVASAVIPDGLNFRFALTGDTYFRTDRVCVADEHGRALLILSSFIENPGPADNEGIVGIKEFYDVHSNTFKLISEG